MMRNCRDKLVKFKMYGFRVTKRGKYDYHIRHLSGRGVRYSEEYHTNH
jgi:hypothetical protein